MACNVGCEFEPYFKRAQTNFTCQQLIDYCAVYSSWTDTDSKIQSVTNSSLFIAGLGGLISYILMIFAFRLPDFNGASFIYHKSMLAMEILHMICMCQSGLVRQLNLPDSYSHVIYRDLCNDGWLIGDMMKLSVSTLTMFLSMERFVAIWMPSYFSVINHARVAWSFVMISLLISFLHFSTPFVFSVVPQVGNGSTGLYVAQAINVGPAASGKTNIGGDYIIAYIIYGIKITTSIAMITFCCGVALELVIKSKKAATMNNTARNKWAENRRLSILQIVIALLQIFDHFTWVINNIIQDHMPDPMLLGSQAILETNFANAIYVMNYRKLWRWTWGVQSVTGELDHAGRLPIYLLGMKKFRDSFRSIFKKIGPPNSEVTPASMSTNVRVMPVVENE